MSVNVTQSASGQVLWKQIWGLVSLNAAIVISWIAYHNYQPKLLEQFQLTDLSGFLLVAQAAVLFAIPPVAGWLGDRVKGTKGNALPVMTAGVSLVAMVFMSVVFALVSGPIPGLAVIFPILVVLWLISMNIFHSPAVAMVEMLAPVERLPMVMAILTLVTDLIYALDPIIVDIIDFVGAPGTFALGGVLIFASGFFFRGVSQHLRIQEQPNQVAHSDYFLVFVVGLVLGIITGVLSNYFPGWLETQAIAAGIELNGNLAVCGIFALTALAAVPLSKYTEGQAKQTMVTWSASLCLLVIAVIAFSPSFWVTALLLVPFALGMSLLSITALPLALTRLRLEEKILGVGIFFSGVELCNSLLKIYLS